MADVIDIDADAEALSEEQYTLREGFEADYHEFINSKRVRRDEFQERFDLSEGEMNVIGGFEDGA